MLTGMALSALGGRGEGFDFTFSAGDLGPDEIFESSTSPPSRYLLEVARRIMARAPLADILVLANPLLPLKAAQLEGWNVRALKSPAVLADADGFPLVYVLPRWLFEESERFVLLLSMVDAGLDQRLLQAVLGREVRLSRNDGFRLGAYPVSTSTGWFQGRDRQQAYKVLTASALQIIAGNPGWRQVPFAVYHPYHAGSIVFFAAASRAVEQPIFSRHIVCSTYRDIVAAADSRLAPLWLKLPWLPRDGSIGEPQYFAAALDRLGPEVVLNNFIVFMRYSRNSGAGRFHLIDQDRFSLGESLQTGTSLTQVQAPAATARCALPAAPLKVLFHITGGIDIKNYPKDSARQLIRALSLLGVSVSVIGRPDLEAYGATSLEADETDLLSEAVAGHHIFVGLDSFPHHFVRNVMGWPTIGLFGTTPAANYGGGWHSHYRTLDASLPCHPCGSEQGCPIFGTAECANYPSPRRLLTAILEMAQQVYGFTPGA
ncbi:hypothetical protein GALL_242980 [mine drainage metagenome]|uniref:Glycosyltransferase family 9 (Heptosyltransferase) n=1 Tax=mine drainage metagenome TaxID=410659 RepID=A0A1J5RW74_9ZZZZ